MEAAADGARRKLLSGCTDPASQTYDDAATAYAPSACKYGVLGCTDSSALNFMPMATAENELAPCAHAIFGCTIAEGTLNYDSTATVLRGCVNVRTGCTESTASRLSRGPAHKGVCTARE